MKIQEGVRKYLELSTSHVPKDEWDRMAEDEDVHFIDHIYGRFVWVGTVGDIVGSLPALAHVLDRAGCLGCLWVNFDCDNEPVDDLPAFEWRK